ncbi:KAP family P-loop NTPase fold protein [Rosistilla oblonga]|uniref:KAP family P-loop NTPase fold protein n=1 Tax=Rosistilla oblonga TaxID=2527990 RepID=UPI003A97491A
MWPDNETDIDFLNFGGVADTVAEIVVQAKRRPISIGVSGAWGVGKSSMIRLVHNSLNSREGAEFLFVEFNAWLYQGYDDVRAALLEIIAKAIKDKAEESKTGIDKATELVKRVSWLRVAKLTAGTAASLSFGLPPVGLIGEILNLGKAVIGDSVDKDVIEQMQSTGTEVIKEAAGLLKDRKTTSPPQEIHAIRQAFEDALEELNVTLVVLIDDLDRCLPETTISTLEAIRLFLFLENTAFVIAADNGMIKHAVRRHFDFEGIDESYITSYFDKLIQVPIRVPPLGTQEVRAYLMMLFVEISTLEQAVKDDVREKVCRQLALTWKGKRVDRAFMDTLEVQFDVDTIARFDTADRLAPLMTTATDIKGNPRLIKRFLNALSIRMAISKANDIGVDEAVLAKLLLFERCGNSDAYGALIDAVSASQDGKPTFLAEWENAVSAGDEKVQRAKPWDEPFVEEWLSISPKLADVDLRGALYVSREHAPLITPEDRLSSEGAELLTALLEYPDMAADLRDRLVALPRPEITVVLDRLLERARREQEWGVPPILEACLAVTRADQSQGTRLAGFLSDRPPGQITPPIVMKIAGEPWSELVFTKWKDSDVVKPVKKAIEKRGKDGDV